MNENFIYNYLEKPRMSVFIYALLDSNNNEIKYIGQTTQGFRRIKDHYTSCGKLSKKKMSDCHNDIKLIFKDEFGNIYNSLKEASLILGVSKQTIHKALIGQLKTAGGRKLYKISGGTSNRKSRGE